MIGSGFHGNWPSRPDVRRDEPRLGVVQASGLTPQEHVDGHETEAGRTQRLSIGTLAVIGRFENPSGVGCQEEVDLADAFESLGFTVLRIPQGTCDGIEPCAEWALFTGAPSSYQHALSAAKSCRKILWTLDWPLGDVSGLPMVDIARWVDIFASSDTYDWLGLHGIRNHAYIAGACERFEPDFAPKPARKCAFIGRISNERQRRISGTILAMGGEVFDLHGRSGPELSRLVQSTKITVIDNARNDIAGHWSVLNYAIPGAGGFLVTPEVPGLEAHLATGRHVVTYRDVEELAGLIERWSRDDTEREAIRRGGFVHIRANHTWEARVQSLLDAMAAVSGKPMKPDMGKIGGRTTW